MDNSDLSKVCSERELLFLFDILTYFLVKWAHHLALDLLESILTIW